MPPTASEIEDMWRRTRSNATYSVVLFIQGVAWGLLIFQTLSHLHLSSRPVYGIIYSLLILSMLISRLHLKASQRRAKAAWIKFRAWTWDQFNITLPVEMPVDPQGWEAVNKAIAEWKGPSEEARQD